MISWGCKMNATQLMQFVSYYLPDKKIFFQLTVFDYFSNKTFLKLFNYFQKLQFKNA